MKNLTTSDLKVKFLGVTPVLKENEEVVLNPQQIASLSALITFKGKSIKKLLKEILDKGENLDQKIKTILQKSCLRGHASIATTPSLCFAYEASKFFDSAITGIVFSSSLMASGRRTTTTTKDIVYPQKILKNKKALALYKKTSELLINTYSSLIISGINKDGASKLLQYGIYGTGIIQLPIESIVALKREYEQEKDWMPEEVGLLINQIEKKLKSWGLDLLYSTRVNAPRNPYFYPNIFKNPDKSNIVRDLRLKYPLSQEPVIIDFQTLITKGLKQRIAELSRNKKSVFAMSATVVKKWRLLLQIYQHLLRDYDTSLRFKVLSTIPWRIWSEKKRHRTVPQTVESIYWCVARAFKVLIRYQKLIRNHGKINASQLVQIEKIISIPLSVKKDKKLLNSYLLAALQSLITYKQLIKLGVGYNTAIFVIPRAIKIDVLQEYNLYNLISGYYPLRLCSTAEEEMKLNTVKEAELIKAELKKRKLGYISDLIGPKCEMMGFCPEEKSCFHIKTKVKTYKPQVHQRMKMELNKATEKTLKDLGK